MILRTPIFFFSQIPMIAALPLRDFTLSPSISIWFVALSRETADNQQSADDMNDACGIHSPT
jgi:hypothetical protein